jgi:hypothetical protein
MVVSAGGGPYRQKECIAPVSYLGGRGGHGVDQLVGQGAELGGKCHGDDKATVLVAVPVPVAVVVFIRVQQAPAICVDEG